MDTSHVDVYSWFELAYTFQWHQLTVSNVETFDTITNAEQKILLPPRWTHVEPELPKYVGCKESTYLSPLVSVVKEGREENSSERDYSRRPSETIYSNYS